MNLPMYDSMLYLRWPDGVLIASIRFFDSQIRKVFGWTPKVMLACFDVTKEILDKE